MISRTLPKPASIGQTGPRNSSAAGGAAWASSALERLPVGPDPVFCKRRSTSLTPCSTVCSHAGVLPCRRMSLDAILLEYPATSTATEVSSTVKKKPIAPRADIAKTTTRAALTKRPTNVSRRLAIGLKATARIEAIVSGNKKFLPK